MKFHTFKQKDFGIFKENKRLYDITTFVLIFIVTIAQTSGSETVNASLAAEVRDHDFDEAVSKPEFDTPTDPTTATTLTSTVRPWPSHDFFQNVLGMSSNVDMNIKRTETASTFKPNTTTTTTTATPISTTTIKVRIGASSYSRNSTTSTATTITTIKVGEVHETTETPESDVSFDIEPTSPMSVLLTSSENAADETHEEDENDDEGNLPAVEIPIATRTQLSRQWIFGPTGTSGYFPDKQPLLERQEKYLMPANVMTKSQLPLRVDSHAKVQRLGNGKTTLPKLYTQVAESHFSGHGNNSLYTNNKSKPSLNTDYVDDEEINPYGWLTKDHEFTAAPLSKTPNFSRNIWPYTKRAPTVTTTIKELASTKRHGATTFWTRVPTIIVERPNRFKVTTQHWGSVGTTVPSVTTPPTPEPLKTTTTEAIKPITLAPPPTTSTTPVTFTNQALYSDILHVSERPLGIEGLFSTVSPTNIWYKPTINHYSSQPNTSSIQIQNQTKYEILSPQAQQLSTETTQSPNIIETKPNKEIIFKIWNYLDGGLKLQNQKEIPSWVLKGHEFRDGQVLNLEQLPEVIKDLVVSTVTNNVNVKSNSTVFSDTANLKNNTDTALHNRHEREQQYYWQQLPTPAVQPVSSEQADNGDPYSTSWADDLYNKPLSLNYVVWSTPKPNADSVDYLITQNPGQRYPSSAETSTQSTDVYKDYLQNYLQHLTTPKTTFEQVAEREKWGKLQTILQQLMSTTTAPPVKDSRPLENIQDPDVLANLATVALIMSHLKNQFPSPNSPNFLAPPSTTYTPVGITPPERDHFMAAVYPLLQHMLVNRNFNFIPPPKAPGINHPFTGPSRFEQQYSTPISITEQYADEGDPYTKTLLVTKGLKKHFKKKKKKKAKKKKKKKKQQNGLFNPEMLQLFRPGKYGFSLDLGIDFVGLLREKFLGLIALKYAPVFLLLALGLVPLGLVFIPIILKKLKKKKKPHYIRVPYPYPQYYPVYYPQQTHQNLGWPSHQGYDHDHQYAGDNTGYNGDDIDHHEEHIYHHYDDTGNVYSPENHGDKGYGLGLSIGSKIGTKIGSLANLAGLTSKHDQEVLKILIDNKKDTINKLLDKWKLKSKSNNFVPPYEDPHSDEYNRKDRKRRKKK